MTLRLTRTDLGDPDAPVFTARGVPIVDIPLDRIIPKVCGCLGHALDEEIQSGFSFSFDPPWDQSWTLEEIRKEECRRICWSALSLVSSHTAQCAAFHEDSLQLELAEPSNVRFL